MKLAQAVSDNLEKCRCAAIAAVDVYNRPGPRFRTAQFIVMINIAWTALLHAIFYDRHRRPWYRRSGTGKRVLYVKVDGDPKHWELRECLKQDFGTKNPPERKNLEFLVRLRDKIEHRHLPELDATLYGECQAALLNLEELLFASFGAKHGLTEQLAVSLQFSSIIPDAKARASKRATTSSTKSVLDFVERFRGTLPAATLNSMKYSFSVYLVPKVANRQSAADVAVTFVKVDETSSDELSRLGKLNVLIREKQIPIANLGYFKPGEVVLEVRKRLPHPAINLHVHTCAWKYFGVRPSGAAARRDKTRPEYCVFDETHEDYVYTEAWVKKLSKDLADPVIYRAILKKGSVES